jgi:hypothetical protein
MTYQGQLDASSGNLPVGAFVTGDFYNIAVGGTLSLRTSAGGPVPTVVVVGDQVIYDESITAWWYNAASTIASMAASAVTFVPGGTIAATNVQTALSELDSETNSALGSINTSLSGKVNRSGDTMTGTLVSESNRTDATWSGSQIAAKTTLGSTLDFASVAFWSADASNAPMVGFNRVSDTDQTLGFFRVDGTKAFVIDMTKTFPDGVVQIKDGIAGGGQVLGIGSDLNTLVTSGFYFITDSTANHPTGFTWSQLVVSRVDDTASQTIVAFDTGKMATRGWTVSTNTWSPWVIHGGDAAYVNVTGDTMTGQLKGITPVAAADLTRKDYVDSKVAKSGDTMTGGLKVGGSGLTFPDNSVQDIAVTSGGIADRGSLSLPGGVKIQYGSAVLTFNASGDANLPFNSPFPNTAWLVSCLSGDAAAAQSVTFSVISSNLSGANLRCLTVDPYGLKTGAVRVNWMAAGT